MTAKRPRAALALSAAVLAFAGFVALGTWQVQRRAWKLDLIERVDRRVHAPAVAAPGPDRWATITAADDEYRHVQVTGHYLPSADAYVQAVTERGSGFWLMSPLRQADGSVVLINRGFVSTATATAGAAALVQPGATISVTGLLRISEPGGGFLRKNDPAANRWYSRDVQSIAAARSLGPVAPYFIDAEASPNDAAGEPIGGLTVISFHNSHLVYALTWYTLALMVAGGAGYVIREERRRPKTGGTDAITD